MSEVQDAYASVLDTLQRRYEWERSRARGEVTVATAPDPAREVRFLIAAVRREADSAHAKDALETWRAQ